MLPHRAALFKTAWLSRRSKQDIFAGAPAHGLFGCLLVWLLMPGTGYYRHSLAAFLVHLGGINNVWQVTTYQLRHCIAFCMAQHGMVDM
jgi:hypothetical protein